MRQDPDVHIVTVPTKCIYKKLREELLLLLEACRRHNFGAGEEKIEPYPD
jgi:hypothetical protein